MSGTRQHLNKIFKRHPDHGFNAVWGWYHRHPSIGRMKALLQWARARGFWPQAKVYKKKLKWLHEHRDPKPPPHTGPLTTFDAHTVPTWIASILQEARNAHAWSGSVISGYRSPAYSTSLCEAMCGAPTCPGRCAGANSNHSCPPTHTGIPYEGAVDVTDPYGLESYCRSHGKPLYGGGYALPSDINHFSHTGN